MKQKGKRTLTPKLRFPEFRDSGKWNEQKLGEIIALEYGSPLPEKDRKSGRFPVIGSNGIVGCHDEAIVDGPAIVVGRKGSAGQVNWIESDCYPIDTTFFVKNLDPVSRPFAFLWRLLERSNLERLGDAGAVPGLNRNEVYLLKTYIPAPPEQRKIAECLSSLDGLIAAEGRKLAVLRDHKRGLMQQLFPQPGQTQPRLRFPEYEKNPEWEERTLEDVCDLKAGSFVRATEIVPELGEGLFPCYGGNGLRGYVTTFTHSGRFVLIGRQGALCGNVNLFDGKFHATEHALVTTPKPSISIDWLFYALTGLDLNRFATGQAQPGLSVSVLNSVDICVSENKVEQQRIADCLTALDTLIAAQAEKIDALKAHKRGLMQQLFPSPEEQ